VEKSERVGMEGEIGAWGQIKLRMTTKSGVGSTLHVTDLSSSFGAFHAWGVFGINSTIPSLSYSCHGRLWMGEFSRKATAK
jgi:hypothetical protein